MTVRETIKDQIKGALAGACFPIASPEALIAAFPNGAATTCQAGELVITAGDAGKVLTAEDFPFTSAEHVAETIVEKAGL